MTVTRTLRLDEDLDQALEKLAREEGESVNVLASRALRKLVEWDFQAGKVGLVSIDKDTLIRLMDKQTPDEAKELGRSAVTEVVVPDMLYLFGAITIDSGLRLVSVIDRYMLRIDSEYSFRDGRHHLTLRHSMGPKWSAFYAGAVEELLAKNLAMDVVSTMTDDACFFEFQPKVKAGESEKTASLEQH